MTTLPGQKDGELNWDIPDDNPVYNVAGEMTDDAIALTDQVNRAIQAHLIPLVNQFVKRHKLNGRDIAMLNDVLFRQCGVTEFALGMNSEVDSRLGSWNYSLDAEGKVIHKPLMPKKAKSE